MKPPHTIVGPLYTTRQLLFNLKLLTGWKRLVPPPPLYNYKAIMWYFGESSFVPDAPHTGRGNHCPNHDAG